MERIITMTDFDEILQEWYENRYGVQIAFQQTPDGDYSLSISGDTLDEIVGDLASLSSFQAALQTPAMQEFMSEMIDHFGREINNPGGQLN